MRHKATREAASWVVFKRINQDFRLVLEEGTVLDVQLADPCPRGDYAVIPDEEDDLHGWHGIQRGDPLMVLGVLSQADPPVLRGQDHFVGSIDEYEAHLGSSPPFPGFIMAFLAGLALFHGGRRTPRPGD